MSAMATDGVAMDCFSDMYKALSSTVRPKEAVHGVHAAHALGLTRVSQFLLKSSVFLPGICVPPWAGGILVRRPDRSQPLPLGVHGSWVGANLSLKQQPERML